MAGGSFRGVVNRVKRTFQDLSALQKSIATTVAVVLLVVFATVWLVLLTARTVWTDHDPMGVLIDGIDPTSAGVVAEYLKKQRVRHELSRDRTRIVVPQNLVGQLRLRMVGENIIGGDRLGWNNLESLDQADFSRKTTAKLAKEAELSKILREGMPSLITWATVQISPARDSVFAADREDAKASVALRLRGKESPPEESIRSVKNLVAHSIEGLRPENVVVTDQFARILSERGSQAKATDASQREEGSNGRR